MLVSKLDKSIGIEVYATSSPGTSGIIRQHIEDFVVKEMLVDGSIAEINHSVKRQVLGATFSKNRYLLCVLVKRDWDIFLALRAIAEQLNISTKRIQIAGIKDAKAVTAQHVTIEGVSTKDVAKVQVKDITVHPIGYVRSKISPYFLLGNNFYITIRALKHSTSPIQKRITETVREIKTIGGVPNFFGHQRFGTTRPITHLVGKALVKGNVRKAAMLFLAKLGSHEHPESRHARKQLQDTQDFQKALKEFPKKLHYERLMLRHLIKKPGDFTGAFRRLPMKLRKLFPQAYQSYLFNKFLSRRIANGISLNRAEVGDYVVNVERSGLPMPNMCRIANIQTTKELDKAVEADRMRIAIPLIGFKRRPSQGLQGEIERKILEEERILPENFKIRAMPEISSRDELRTVIVPLNNFSIDEISDDSANPSKRQAKLSFMLYRGSYATIPLREIIKPHNIIEAGF
ncbi:tRNA pseudouridine(13) synthase TruD [Candidatus Bathyarchaeota archaeon]|nr:tRNA pseudouridine(13) synthase TruD [Candidatus Bathyarchaeota archaeon]